MKMKMKIRQKTDSRIGSDNSYYVNFMHLCMNVRVDLNGRLKKRIPQREKLARLSVLAGIPQADVKRVCALVA